MARKYDTVEIDGVQYEKHGVKADDKKIGFVPVRLFAPDESVDSGESKYEEFHTLVANADDGELILIIADWKYGNGVRLQGMARKCVSGEGFSDTAMNKTYAAMTLEECAQFHQDHAGLVKFCKVKWAEMQASGAEDVDETKVWEELL